MIDEKWRDLVGRIKDTFPVEEEYNEPLGDIPGTREGLIFSGVAGRMKLERVTRPVVLGTHAVTSKRIGATAKVEYDYSETDNTQAVSLYHWNNNAWETMDLSASFLA